MDRELKQEINRLVSDLIDGQLSPGDASRLERVLADSPEAIAWYLELMDNHEALCAVYPGEVYADSIAHDTTAQRAGTETGLETGTETGVGSITNPVANPTGVSALWTVASAKWWAIAAGLLVAVGLTGYWVGTERISDEQTAKRDLDSSHGTGAIDRLAPTIQNEQTLAGHATLRRSIDLKWSGDGNTFREGDVLPDGRLQFTQGVAEVDFFCGATLIIEGPADLEIQSDWSVQVTQGRLRANVPPAARGFIVKTADSEIVDLGTEFALEVGANGASVEVIDGEIELRGGPHDGDHLVTGEEQLLRGTSQTNSFDGLSTWTDLEDRRINANADRFKQWRQSSQTLRTDRRLIAYYPMTEMRSDRLVHNAASTGPARDGKLIGPVERAMGRFGDQSLGLELGRPGARVRLRIDGKFDAFTFSCWAKIDSLDHIYNALFMADGYENGEPHWQIRNDGRLMFSVMVDDSQPRQHYSKIEQRVVEAAGVARVYYSEPFWDVSKSGQWFHLVSVYDPGNRLVTHYVNAKQVGQGTITDKFFIDQLRIGPSEIGNWGQPFRDTPSFAVRNLNGTIDELAIFDAALDHGQVKQLYQKGKPLGY